MVLPLRILESPALERGDRQIDRQTGRQAEGAGRERERWGESKREKFREPPFVFHFGERKSESWGRELGSSY